MVGSIVRSINSGLGNLCWEFQRHGLIDKALIIKEEKGDIMFPERFPNGRISSAVHFSNNDMEWLLDGIDTLLIFETAYRWDIVSVAKKRGIRIVIMPMHEFIPEVRDADIWLCPSDLEMKLPVVGEKIRINVPVNTDKIKWRLREKAEHFIHNAGGGGIMGRNGTNELVSALKYIDDDFRLTIRSQVYKYGVDDNRVEIRHENLENYWDLWDNGDVLVLPDKFAGLSLPIQEAFASGMMVMTTNKKPFSDWLPNDPLIQCGMMVNNGRYDMAVISPKLLADSIKNWIGKDIKEYSLAGKKWAEENSWEVLLPRYKEILYGQKSTQKDSNMEDISDN